MLVAMDVGWQRHVADALDGGDEVGSGSEAERALAEVAGGENGGGEAGITTPASKLAGGPGIKHQGTGIRRRCVVEEERFAGLNFFCGADEGTPVVVAFARGKVLGEEDFDEAGRLRRVVLGVQAGACGVEACGKDARVVEDEEIAGGKELRKFGEVMVSEVAGGAREREHAAGAAGVGRMLRDEIFGEIVVEVGDEHEDYSIVWR